MWWRATGMPLSRMTFLNRSLSIASADAATPAPTYGTSSELEQPLHRAVLAERPVQDRGARRRPRRVARAFPPRPERAVSPPVTKPYAYLVPRRLCRRAATPSGRRGRWRRRPRRSGRDRARRAPSARTRARSSCSLDRPPASSATRRRPIIRAWWRWSSASSSASAAAAATCTRSRGTGRPTSVTVEPGFACWPLVGILAEDDLVLVRVADRRVRELHEETLALQRRGGGADVERPSRPGTATACGPFETVRPMVEPCGGAVPRAGRLADDLVLRQVGLDERRVDLEAGGVQRRRSPAPIDSPTTFGTATGVGPFDDVDPHLRRPARSASPAGGSDAVTVSAVAPRGDRVHVRVRGARRVSALHRVRRLHAPSSGGTATFGLPVET